jgi:hypothetical protein
MGLTRTPRVGYRRCDRAVIAMVRGIHLLLSTFDVSGFSMLSRTHVDIFAIPYMVCKRFALIQAIKGVLLFVDIDMFLQVREDGLSIVPLSLMGADRVDR